MQCVSCSDTGQKSCQANVVANLSSYSLRGRVEKTWKFGKLVSGIHAFLQFLNIICYFHLFGLNQFVRRRKRSFKLNIYVKTLLLIPLTLYVSMNKSFVLNCSFIRSSLPNLCQIMAVNFSRGKLFKSFRTLQLSFFYNVKSL